MGTADVADCELRDGWGFAQDVNAWSSLAYVAVGVVVAATVLRRRRPRVFLVLAALTVLEGLGSMLFHGRGGDLAQLIHDGALLGLVGFVAGWHAGRLASPPATSEGASLGAAAGVTAGAVAGAVSSAVVTNLLAATGIVAVAATEVLARRRGRPAVWNGGLLAVLVLGVGAWALGTPDSPLCAARSWAQPHALWHALSALVLLWWVDRTLEAEPDDAGATRTGCADA